ncbi:maltose ABC transporter permease MalF [Niveibacterium umoris]|uniref:Maltose/maltodextrin transport system permease protein n=1 Tax=Niveibacterium umoris TaxID=1193620 RepID=A0A840BN26_9RHOO|nr:maltose ABC transporter permease MalF [Niveibacterium umoris]MBB4014043.1 maltose/maltodextrin transport system permease protein [Niveibacterium umoris]
MNTQCDVALPPTPASRLMTRDAAPWLRLLTRSAPIALGLVSVLLGLLVTLRLYATGQLLFALIALAVVAAGVFVYAHAKATAWRFLFPGLLGATLFVVLPIAYTISLSTSNYASQNLLTFGRATEFLLTQRYLPEGAQRYEFALLPDGKKHRARLESETGEVFLSEPFTLGHSTAPVCVRPVPQADTTGAADTATLVREVAALKTLTLQLPNGSVAQMSGLRSFDESRLLYRRNPDGSLTNQQDQSRLHANRQTGYYETDTGERVAPGFAVWVGAAQYLRLLTDAGLSEPFLKVFAWTFAYSLLTVGISFAIGLLLASLLSWQELAFRDTYKLLYYLPNAVPGLIATLIVRMMFFTNTGEVNAVLDTVFGIRPEWYATPALARTMVLIVSIWLCFPYMMMVCLGLIRAIPQDLYEASALAGAGPIANLRYITLPLIARPALPLLIASFAFTFNNAGLILYLTDGGPSYLDTREPIGTTDLLSSAAYRIAFTGGSNFGLAAAISVLLFAIVAVLAFASLRLSKSGELTD